MFTCTICRFDREGKKYVFASSNRKIRFLICVECYKIKLAEMQQLAEKFGEGMVLGVLRDYKEE